jgi:hypothetical protein
VKISSSVYICTTRHLYLWGKILEAIFQQIVFHFLGYPNVTEAWVAGLEIVHSCEDRQLDLSFLLSDDALVCSIDQMFVKLLPQTQVLNRVITSTSDKIFSSHSCVSM